MKERRKSPRYAVDAAVHLTAVGGSASGRLRDLCKDAALVEVGAPPPLDTFVTLAIELPDGAQAVEVSGRVIRVTQGDRGVPAAAILFTDVSDEAAGAIEAFLAGQTESSR